MCLLNTTWMLCSNMKLTVNFLGLFCYSTDDLAIELYFFVCVILFREGGSGGCFVLLCFAFLIFYLFYILHLDFCRFVIILIVLLWDLLQLTYEGESSWDLNNSITRQFLLFKIYMREILHLFHLKNSTLTKHNLQNILG